MQLCPTKKPDLFTDMSEDSQKSTEPAIYSKVSAKTRGYLVQANKHRIAEEEEEKAKEMSGEQT